MTLIGFLIAVAIVGLIVWIFTAAIPLPQPFAKIVLVVGVVIVVILLLQLLGVVASPRISTGL
jgi:hypothetical protein